MDLRRFVVESRRRFKSFFPFAGGGASRAGGKCASAAVDKCGKAGYNVGMNKRNYNREMEEILARSQGSSLLLHSCCAPCSSHCLEVLHAVFRVSVLYYNPNICGEEYEKRKQEQKRLLSETGWADFVDCDHDEEAFLRVAAGYEGAPEGGARCYRCFSLRLEETARRAREGGYDYFATTLTVSPLKNAEWLNQIGFACAEKYGVAFLPSDFKKKGGYLRSIELSKRYGLYRQNFCGCVFSEREALSRHTARAEELSEADGAGREEKRT